MKKYQALIDQALIHIERQQFPDGSFAHLSSTAPDDFSGAIPRHTTFFAANISSCLHDFPGKTADVRRRAADFLLSQKSGSWSFNYWAEGTSTSASIPDDLDDTFSAIAALARHDRGIIDGHACAAIAKMLTAREVGVGGPYRTWLVSDAAPKKWQDVDIAANAAIGYALSLIGVQLPTLERFIDNAVCNGRITSPYYPGMFPVGYFLSRYYRARNGIGRNDRGNDGDGKLAGAKLAGAIAERLQKNDDTTITPLERTMGMLSLVNLGAAGQEEVLRISAALLAARFEREGFLPYAFCIDPARDGKPSYAGASALTAAFAAAALARYSSDAIPPANAATEKVLAGHDHIRVLARAACKNIGADLRAAAEAQIEKTTDERITALPYEFRDALYYHGMTIPSDITEQLSLASLYGWMAYTIYDDALDEDEGEGAGDGKSAGGPPSHIPCANFFLRELTAIYLTLATRAPEIGRLFKNTMCRIDEANSWEQNNCRVDIATAGSIAPLPAFGDHGTLADRSIGHAMGPLAELILAGYPPSSEEYKNTELFFRHYLIARQLHDDAHDWEKDLLRGRVNSVGAIILARFKEKYPAGKTKPPIDQATQQLQELFSKKVIDDVALAITGHVDSARQARRGSVALDGTDTMESDLRKLESGAGRAIKERDEIVVFLKEYGKI